MPVDVTTVLRKALSELESQKARLDRQIAALHAALDGDAATSAPNSTRTPSRRRPRMNAAARRAVGLRMKAYWAKRREAAKVKARTGTRAKTRRASRKKK